MTLHSLKTSLSYPFMYKHTSLPNEIKNTKSSINLGHNNSRHSYIILPAPGKSLFGHLIWMYSNTHLHAFSCTLPSIFLHICVLRCERGTLFSMCPCSDPCLSSTKEIGYGMKKLIQPASSFTKYH